MELAMPMLTFPALRAVFRPRLPLLPATLACLTALTPHASAAPERPAIISLAELGLQPAGARPPAAGSTVATVHFVGDHHVLVTFGVRRLMKRLPDCPPEDEDRLIEAVLVDVPSGKVAARTTWRVHDSGQYLWELGHGHFLLRQRDRLAVIAPLAHLSTEQPFEEAHLLGFERKVVGILVSAESDLLTVETVDPEAVREANGNSSGKKFDHSVEVNFYRLLATNTSIGAQHSGMVHSKAPVEVPMTRDGYLDVAEESKTRWLFDYYTHEGKKKELSPFDTSCFPRATFVSRTEFIALGCHGSLDKVEIGGFDMSGQQMWQQNFYDSFVRPTFSFAPESGRFAIGRALTGAPISLIGQDPDGGQLTGQDVLVLQSHSGKQLFHTVVTPAQRNGQNFSLSADGERLAVVRNGSIEVTKLPTLSGKDRQELKTVRDLPLEVADGPIRLPSRTQRTLSAGLAPTAPTPNPAAPVLAVPLASAAPPPPATTAIAPATPPRPVENIILVGDVPNDGPRKKPSLYSGEDAPPPSAPPTPR